MHHSALPEPVIGTQEFERALGGAFVMQRSAYDDPDVPNSFAVLSGTECHYFDVRGVIRVYDMTLDDEGWSMTFLDDAMSQRITATFETADVMELSGDASYDRGATWTPDFTVTYRRV